MGAGGNIREPRPGAGRLRVEVHVTTIRRLVVVTSTLLLVAACGGASLSAAPRIAVTAARTPLPASPDVGAVYLTIKNDSRQPDVLLSATSDVAAQTMLHTDVTRGPTELMVPAGPVTIQPGQSLVLTPGGYHLMLMNLTRTLAVGDTIQVTLVFKRAGRIVVDVPVVSLVAGASSDTMPPGMHMP
jgi:copper(I)-binding protein